MAKISVSIALSCGRVCLLVLFLLHRSALPRGYFIYNYATNRLSDNPTDASKPTILEHLSPHIPFHVASAAINSLTRRLGGDPFTSPILAPAQQSSDSPDPHRLPQLRYFHLSRTLPHGYIFALPPPSRRRRRALSQPGLHRIDTGNSGHSHWSHPSYVLLQSV